MTWHTCCADLNPGAYFDDLSFFPLWEMADRELSSYCRGYRASSRKPASSKLARNNPASTVLTPELFLSHACMAKVCPPPLVEGLDQAEHKCA